MRRALVGRPGITEKKMFGGFCWMLHGNMLCGVEVGRYMFRVGKELESEALARPGSSPMDITGKPMRGFVWVQADEAGGPRAEKLARSCLTIRGLVAAEIARYSYVLREVCASRQAPIDRSGRRNW